MSTVRVLDIRQGDRFELGGVLYWTALEDAELHRDADDEPIVVLAVRFADGGIGERVWDNPAHSLPGVTRARA